MIQEEKKWQEEEAAEAAEVQEEAAEAVECVPVQVEEEVAVVWEDVVRSQEAEDPIMEDIIHHQDHQDIITIIITTHIITTITMVEHITVAEEVADVQAYQRQLF